MTGHITCCTTLLGTNSMIYFTKPVASEVECCVAVLCVLSERMRFFR